MINSLPATPVAALEAWWQAMQDRDLTALERLTAGDYLASGGPAGRTTSRSELLAEADAFFAEAVVEDWSLASVRILDLGSVAVCAYDWSERGQHAGRPFALAGMATDVLVRSREGWRHQAHHVSLQPAQVAA